MAKIDEQLDEDRMLRDAANAVFKADMQILRATLSPREVATRLENQGKILSAKAKDFAAHNRGGLAAGSAAIAVLAALSFARKPVWTRLSALFGRQPPNGDALAEPEALAEPGALPEPQGGTAPSDYPETDEISQSGQ